MLCKNEHPLVSTFLAKLEKSVLVVLPLFLPRREFYKPDQCLVTNNGLQTIRSLFLFLSKSYSGSLRLGEVVGKRA